MRYNCETNPPPIFPCQVLDADGVKIELPIVEFDDETGEVIHQVMDDEGNPKHALYPPSGVEAKPIQIEDCPFMLFKSPEGVTKKIRAKPMDKTDWEEKPLVETKSFKAPLSMIPVGV